MGKKFFKKRSSLPGGPSDSSTSYRRRVSLRLNFSSPLQKLRNNSTKPSTILFLPTEIILEIFSHLTTFDIQDLFDTHSRFREIIIHNRGFLCQQITNNYLTYYADCLPISFFNLQQQHHSRLLPSTSPLPPISHTNWYIKLYKLDISIRNIHHILPPEAAQESEYYDITGRVSRDDPLTWPNLGHAFYNLEDTLLSFYQFNSLFAQPTEISKTFKQLDIRAINGTQGYYRSTAHRGLICCMWRACVGYDKSDGQLLKQYLPENRGDLGAYMPGTRIATTELFKLMVMAVHPANILKVMKSPDRDVMGRVAESLALLKRALVEAEEERRQRGATSSWSGLEMMEALADYAEKAVAKGGLEAKKLFVLGDWDDLEDEVETV